MVGIVGGKLAKFIEQADIFNKAWGQVTIVLVLIAAVYKIAQYFGFTKSVDTWSAQIIHKCNNYFSEHRKIEERWPAVRDFLNEIFNPAVKAYCIRFDGMPLPVYGDPQEDLPELIDRQLIKKAEILRSKNFFPPYGENLSHGLLVDDEYKRSESPTVKVVKTDYATICAARQLEKSFMIGSAGGLLFNSRTKTIYLQRRSRKSDLHPGFFHTFGGNYEPETGNSCRDHRDKQPLRMTATREIDEETHVGLLDPQNALLIVADEVAGFETSTGFVQFYYLGIELTKVQTAKMYGSRQEGQIHGFTLSELVMLFKTGKYRNSANELEKGYFVPAGAMHIVAWLGLGGPNQYLRCPMRKDALLAYHEIKKDLHSYMSTCWSEKKRMKEEASC